METHYEVEELMGDGHWAPRWQTKEEANYETPGLLRFKTWVKADDYVQNLVTQGWTARYFRVVAVQTVTTRTITTTY